MYQLNEKMRSLKPYDPVEAEDMIHLDANESFLSPPPELLAEMGRAVQEIAYNRYPDPSARELCRAFADCYGVDPSHVTAGNGSDELISVLFSAFLQKGEAFATLEPDFSMYAFNGFLNEAQHVQLRKEDLRPEVDEIIETCNRENVRLLIFSNPCNPTSIVCPREEIRRLVQGVNALVVLDEAYMDFSDQSLLGEEDRYDNLVILRTCSKAMGMAALRLGFAVACPKLTKALQAAKSPYNVNSVSQKLGTLLLTRKDLLKEAEKTIVASREALCKGLLELKKACPDRFSLLESSTNFAALVMPDAGKAYRYLWGEKIAVRLTGGILRITCGTKEENESFLKAFRKYLEQK